MNLYIFVYFQLCINYQVTCNTYLLHDRHDIVESGIKHHEPNILHEYKTFFILFTGQAVSYKYGE